ncbi:hypothetical protein NPIL_616371 [Nephila pilipes]|uniref:Uncharacterized protein n=1 Tax=Nephila pilipes TaxID=299642 RepID=A0A8X6UJ87_NEPPI|nr:hypothetical protein NPIL_616371 [Nephila pilipes]
MPQQQSAAMPQQQSPAMPQPAAMPHQQPAAMPQQQYPPPPHQQYPPMPRQQYPPPPRQQYPTMPHQQYPTMPQHHNLQSEFCSNSGQRNFEQWQEVHEDPECSSSPDNDNEIELVFDPSEILAMRAAKDKDSKKEKDDDSDDTIELINAPVDEKFVFVELDSFGQLQNMVGMKHEPNAEEELESAKEWQKYMYGDKAERITCLETPMINNYNRLCDTYQPLSFPTDIYTPSKV